MAVTEVRDIARGNWATLLPALGVETKFLNRKHGPCPICGGKDRYRWVDWNGSGSYFCAQCGAGDAIKLVMQVTGKGFSQVAEDIRKLTGNDDRSPLKLRDQGPSPEERARDKLWAGAEWPSTTSPVGLYLSSRLGRPWPSEAIREAHLWNAEMGEYLHAMVSEVTTRDGEQINLHLTYLTPEGRKAQITTPKRVLPGTLPEGSAIRIWPAAKRMGIAEGVENAMSAAILFKLPVWSAVSGVMLAKWVPPDEAEEIVIFGDNDASFTGQAKAYQLANRLVVQFKRRVTVMFPDNVGEDWNDRLQAQRPK